MTTGLPTADRAATRRALLGLLRTRRGAVAGVIGLFAAATAVALIGPRLLGIIIDEVTGARDRDVIDTAAAVFLVVTVLGAALIYLADARAGVVGEDVLASLRARLFTRTVALPLATAERAGTGELLARMIGDIAAMATAVRYALPLMVLSAIELILTAATLVVLSPPLSAATLVGLPLGVLASRWYLHRSPGVYRAERERTAELTTALHESVSGATTLAAHRLGPTRLALLHRASAAVFTASMRGAVIRNVLRSSITLSQSLVLATVLTTGAILLHADMVTPGMVTAAAFYVLRLYSPVITLMDYLDELQTAGAAFARISGVLDLTDPPAAPPRPAANGTAVSLRGVHFGYLPDQTVLHNIDLDVPAGERIALVGPSGAGKSTLAAPIAGIHRPQAGTLARTGEVVLLTQEAHTFLGTLADNLRLAAPDAIDEALRCALATVGAEQWVDALPEGLATRVGSDAHRLHAAATADRIAVLQDGRIIELGSHSELLNASGSYAKLWQHWIHHRSAV